MSQNVESVALEVAGKTHWARLLLPVGLAAVSLGALAMAFRYGKPQGGYRLPNGQGVASHPDHHNEAAFAASVDTKIGAIAPASPSFGAALSQKNALAETQSQPQLLYS